MEIEVSIDKFVIDYKDVPHSAFLRVYMVGVQKYKVKVKIYGGTYSYELHIRKSDNVYIHIYLRALRLFTLVLVGKEGNKKASREIGRYTLYFTT
ncbi:hypothetical protein PVA17_16665 [Lysinibacillus sp. CNPSo 3705]|uniref:hypothetical protein n=1 Tax=Lysinibacillus sp. CNPSo 3705 TaxID=3028148 RepID=UPI002364A5AA|nr:hypothetical protein [Lysinibacillus sp. CNPSo 3705]MDD1504376.1 hypothetical protein [Lysinibacillus sp. CNPSo 3705]